MKLDSHEDTRTRKISSATAPSESSAVRRDILNEKNVLVSFLCRSYGAWGGDEGIGYYKDVASNGASYVGSCNRILRVFVPSCEVKI